MEQSEKGQAWNKWRNVETTNRTNDNYEKEKLKMSLMEKGPIWKGGN